MICLNRAWLCRSRRREMLFCSEQTLAHLQQTLQGRGTASASGSKVNATSLKPIGTARSMPIVATSMPAALRDYSPAPDDDAHGRGDRAHRMPGSGLRRLQGCRPAWFRRPKSAGSGQPPPLWAESI